jgi:glycosyltransferase involved in cell wall biosynthesis
MRTLVTVGICVRNGENMLRGAIDSIITQDFPQEQLQVIFVDDGSEDNTSQIITNYMGVLDNRAKFFRTSWRGLGHARNLIIDNADGEYVLFVDCDQILTRNYIKKQVEVMNNPQVGITAGIFKQIPGNLILNLEITPFIVDQMKYNQPRTFIWKTEKVIGTGGTTFRVKALRQANGFDEKIKGAAEDIELVLRIKKAGWLYSPNNAKLYELHGGMSRPKDLWKKYFWYGYGCQKTFAQTRDAFSIPRMSPLAGLIAGIFYSVLAYKYIGQKYVFLLPFHFTLKLTAWTCGFIKGQIKI